MQTANEYANNCGTERRIRNVIKQIWHHLTDDEIKANEEEREIFFLAIRKKHGLPRAQAELILCDLKRQYIGGDNSLDSGSVRRLSCSN